MEQQVSPARAVMPGRYRVVNKRHQRAMVIEEQVSGPHGVYTVRNQGVPVTFHPGSVLDDVTVEELVAFPDRFIATEEAIKRVDEQGQPLRTTAELVAEREAAMKVAAADSAAKAKAQAAADAAYAAVMAEEQAAPPAEPEPAHSRHSVSSRDKA